MVDVMLMQIVQILLVLVPVNVMVGILEMELPALVCKVAFHDIIVPQTKCNKYKIYSGHVYTYILVMYYLYSIIDVDECITANGGCHANANCTNTDGSRTCRCNGGYSGNGISCTGI